MLIKMVWSLEKHQMKSFIYFKSIFYGSTKRKMYFKVYVKQTINARNFQNNLIFYTAIDIVLSIQYFNFHIKHARLKKSVSSHLRLFQMVLVCMNASQNLNNIFLYRVLSINTPVSMERKMYVATVGIYDLLTEMVAAFSASMIE